MLAAMAALATTRIPDSEETETGEIVVKREGAYRQLKINCMVATVTLAKIGDYLVVDPTFEEEVIADYRLVLSFDDKLRIVGAQKTGPGGMKIGELREAIRIGKNVAQVYLKTLDQALKQGA
jgi:RNase PH-related exoribonuclease